MNHLSKFIARLLPERALIKLGRWDECDGEPMNAYAVEFARRDDMAKGVQS